MSGIDIAIIVVVCVLFAAALGYIIYRKVKHKGCCDCADCASCSGGCKKNENKADKVSACCHCCKQTEEQKSE